MQWLPPLCAEGRSWRLPLADRTAVFLVRVLCAENPEDVLRHLVAALRGDPVLALWAVCRAKQAGVEPRDIPCLAAWLCDRFLHWGPDDWPPEDDTADKHLFDCFSQWVEASVTRALLAAALTVEDGKQAADEIYLAALLHEPTGWMQDENEDAIAAFRTLLPVWLNDTEVSPRVAQAVERLERPEPEHPEGESSESPPDLDMDRSHWLGGGATEGWARSDPWVRAPLGQLIGRLARLDALETRFQETLEAEKLAAMAEFAAGAGHEINNPLAVIAGRAQLFLQEETDSERRRGLALINAQAKRVYEMIADMRLFARPPEPAFETVDLIGLVDSLIEAFTSSARLEELAITLRRTGHAGPRLEIEADPTQLTVALQAICRNSVEAIGHDGRIEINLVEEADRVRIAVIDDGPGFSDEVRRHLFDPYYSARQAGRGLGLGLSKVWRIVVTNHGGRIDVESLPGQRTVLMLSLPQPPSRG
ncbi:MAG: HAMP domain-containing histidine kinase [Pirellulales bacterium]|nr:HAMP domain-containing histidine kinase [Pirellulales bacterium]